MSSQIVLVRELLVVFYGNELSVAFILAGWLVAGAIGSALLGRLADGIRSKGAAFSGCLLGLAALLPLNIVLIRSIKAVLGVNPGQTIPLFPVMASGFLVFAPTCIILGFMFVLGCRIYETKSDLGAVRAGAVYVLEASGAGAGGLVTGFVLVRVLGSMQIMAVLSFFAVAAAFILLWLSKVARARFGLLVLAAAMALCGITAFSCGGWSGLDRYLAERQWPGYELLASQNSIYGNIAVLKNGAQFSFFDNGLHLYTVPDEQSSEEAVHFALLEHPAPKSVLLIGGGTGGLVGELLKHPVEKIDYIELDPLIVTMARRHLPREYTSPLDDRRVSVIPGDGRYFIRKSGRKYDCIIISLGDPYTAQLNRFYTAEFFAEARQALRQGGVISLGLGSSESYISGDLGAFLRSMYATLKTAFRDVRIIPGETAYFIASNTRGLLTYDYKVLMDRARVRALDIKYVREYYLVSRLSPEKIAYAENIISAPGPASVNRDFRPISYYYDIVFWTTRFKGSLFSSVLKAVTEMMIWSAAASMCAIIVLWGLCAPRAPRPFKTAAIFAIIANGFSQMAFQIVIVLSFQILYGYLFYKLGLILTAFMAGIASGGWYATRMVRKAANPSGAVLFAQACLVLYPLLLPVIFKKLASSCSNIVSWTGANVVFALLPLAAGFIGGLLFPVVNRIRLDPGARLGRVAGLTYGADLAGSCLGALLTGAFLIPIIGIPGTCGVVAMLNGAVLVALIVSRRN